MTAFVIASAPIAAPAQRAARAMFCATLLSCLLTLLSFDMGWLYPSTLQVAQDFPLSPGPSLSAKQGEGPGERGKPTATAPHGRTSPPSSPSPTPLATRLTEPRRQSPAAENAGARRFQMVGRARLVPEAANRLARQHEAVFVQRDDALQELRVRRCPDKHEQPRARNRLADFAGPGVLERHRLPDACRPEVRRLRCPAPPRCSESARRGSSGNRSSTCSAGRRARSGVPYGTAATERPPPAPPSFPPRRRPPRTPRRKSASSRVAA